MSGYQYSQDYLRIILTSSINPVFFLLSCSSMLQRITAVALVHTHLSLFFFLCYILFWCVCLLFFQYVCLHLNAGEHRFGRTFRICGESYSYLNTLNETNPTLMLPISVKNQPVNGFLSYLDLVLRDLERDLVLIDDEWEWEWECDCERDRERQLLLPRLSSSPLPLLELSCQGEFTSLMPLSITIVHFFIS